jgi:hypothetical protein
MVLVPLVLKPLTPAVAVAVQVNVVPDVPEVSVTAVVVLPEQIT